MMDYPICINCNRPILFTGEKVTMDGRVACACICKVWNVNIISSNSTNAPLVTDWSKNLKIMRDWSMTFTFDGAREPVPDAFQNAFRDGELEL